MEYGICNLAVIPMRAEPNEVSEMVSQVLFGETFEIIEWTDTWAKITTTVDNYTGWIGRLQFAMLGHIAYQDLKAKPSPLTYGTVTQAWKKTDNTLLYLPVGSSLAFLEGNRCKIGNEKFEIIGPKGDIENVVTTAKSFLNSPYLWGGRTHFGIDCSGYVQAVFKLHGINIKRDASQQAEQGTPVFRLKETRLGDLVFFKNAEGRVTHVGMMLSDWQIIHASGKVKIDKIDEDGIYSEELKRYTHTIHSIKRHNKLLL
jgi:gamma-D-glutamyl-L-lysine dipeptidyl-peptidase